MASSLPTIILKNTTGALISVDDIGIEILASPGQYIANELSGLWQIFESDDLPPLISSGDIVVNDGTSDLSIADALEETNRIFLEYHGPGHSEN